MKKRILPILCAALMFTACTQSAPLESELESVKSEDTTSQNSEEDKTIDVISQAEIDPNKPVIALTFDDGPNTSTTLQVIEKLKKYQVVASFFVVGNNINDDTTETIRIAHEIGCEINNHSKTHSYMDKMEAEDIAAEIEYTSEKVKEITGEEPGFFRPPYIAVNDTMHEAIDLPFIAGYGANDWDDSYDAQTRCDLIMDQISDGGIILLHDSEGNSLTVEALDLLIPALLDEGYQFVTVSKLFEIKGIEPKDSYIYTNVLQKGRRG